MKTMADRITINPEIMGGKPCVRGMRVTVGMIAGQIASGTSIDELLQEYRYLEREDVEQALAYAASQAPHAQDPPIGDC